MTTRGNLCLSRKVGESLHIGDGDDVVIVRVFRFRSQKSVGLLINAPREVRVMREEIVDPVLVAERRLWLPAGPIPDEGIWRLDRRAA
jgi:carbon storage regulator CsrA